MITVNQKQRNMKRFLFLFIIFIIGSAGVYSQIEDVIVETYYISGPDDLTDPFGAVLVEGSRTYRVYLDLAEGVQLMSLFGDEDYPFSVRSTTKFFNHPNASGSYGFMINSVFIENFASTLPLDSWLTMDFATNSYFGVQKVNDTDGSVFLPGSLEHTDSKAGIPLTEADGLNITESTYNSYGLTDLEPDNSIFGKKTVGSEFVSQTSIIQTPIGFSDDENGNIILVAQFTTTGELSFQFNVELKINDKLQKFVGRDTSTYRPDVIYSNLLSYPKKKGCTDPYYAEYDPSAVVDDGSCQTPMVLGCQDTRACNFDPEANFHVQELCCYPPDSCDNRNLEVVCPDWYALYGSKGAIHFNVFPNPVSDQLSLEIFEADLGETEYRIYDLYGNQLLTGEIKEPGLYPNIVETVQLPTGLYFIRLLSEQSFGASYFIKE